MKGNFLRKSRTKGVSLIELMVAMLIGLILMAGVVQIYLGTTATNRAQEGLSRVQENARFAMEVLTRNIRMGGHSLCTGQQTVSELDVRLRASNAGMLPVNGGSLDLARAVHGVDSAADLWGSDEPGNLVAGTPALRLMHAEGVSTNAADESFQGGNFDISGNPSEIDQGDLVMVTDCETADVFRVINTTAGEASGTININHAQENDPHNWNEIDNNYNEESQVARFAKRAFYIGTNGQGTPSLYMRRSSGDALEIVENIEAMTFAYGIDTSNDGQVDRYEEAGDVNDWEAVLSIRVAVLVRSEEVLSEARGTTYDMLGQETLQFNDRRIRQLAVSTVSLRNRLP
ncbi:PilW family protein [Aquisalimonas asiatica]|uniref:Type IV pilus assembly protein PilW n=1 Tax=Aquisalimonas asiatica TaxID=406100 RepID=A0A1H8S314_9GAMM|nr:PilW family protein [Aquisalimonas asiatica]SEO72927.1 type IV pilus assembly protein PilW [Aquisalimonas asiatica]